MHEVVREQRTLVVASCEIPRIVTLLSPTIGQKGYWELLCFSLAGIAEIAVAAPHPNPKSSTKK